MFNKKIAKNIFLTLILVFYGIWSFAGHNVPFSHAEIIPVDSPTDLYNIYQLTNNDIHDYNPQISQGQITWHGPTLSGFEIFLYTDSTVTQLTDNLYQNEYPQISNGQVTWLGYDGNGYDVFLYDGSTITKLTTSNYQVSDPQISNGQVTWIGGDQLFLYDGSNVILLSSNYYNQDPQISNGQVTWVSEYSIFLYDGSSVFPLTENPYQEKEPQISNGQVTWLGYDGNDYEVFLYDGSTITRLTDNTYDDQDPKISNGQVTWISWDGNDNEIFLYDGSTITQLTDNNYQDSEPQISNGQVTWQGWVETDYEVFLYDGSTVIQLTDNSYPDLSPQISEGMVTWYGLNGDDYEVYLATVNPYAGLDSFELNIVTGWSMISLPLLPDNPLASSVLDQLDYYQLVTWSGTQYVEALEFEVGKGYWLLSLQDTSITVYGDLVEQVVIDLLPAWNMIGGLNILSNTEGLFPSYNQFVTWNGMSYVDSTVFAPCIGYWAFVLEETRITQCTHDSYIQVVNGGFEEEHPPDSYDTVGWDTQGSTGDDNGVINRAFTLFKNENYESSISQMVDFSEGQRVLSFWIKAFPVGADVTFVSYLDDDILFSKTFSGNDEDFIWENVKWVIDASVGVHELKFVVLSGLEGVSENWSDSARVTIDEIGVFIGSCVTELTEDDDSLILIKNGDFEEEYTGEGWGFEGWNSQGITGKTTGPFLNCIKMMKSIDYDTFLSQMVEFKVPSAVLSFWLKPFPQGYDVSMSVYLDNDLIFTEVYQGEDDDFVWENVEISVDTSIGFHMLKFVVESGSSGVGENIFESPYVYLDEISSN